MIQGFMDVGKLECWKPENIWTYENHSISRSKNIMILQQLPKFWNTPICLILFATKKNLLYNLISASQACQTWRWEGMAMGSLADLLRNPGGWVGSETQDVLVDASQINKGLLVPHFQRGSEELPEFGRFKRRLKNESWHTLQTFVAKV